MPPYGAPPSTETAAPAGQDLETSLNRRVGPGLGKPCCKGRLHLAGMTSFPDSLLFAHEHIAQVEIDVEGTVEHLR